MITGRPKSKLNLPEGWQQDILDAYAAGKSDVEIKCMIHNWRNTFSNDLWDRWLKDEQSFSETIKKGRQLSEGWWNNIGREGAIGIIPIQPAMWIFNMKNRFGWNDKHILDHTGTVKVDKIERTVIEVDNTDSPRLLTTH